MKEYSDSALVLTNQTVTPVKMNWKTTGTNVRVKLLQNH